MSVRYTPLKSAKLDLDNPPEHGVGHAPFRAVLARDAGAPDPARLPQVHVQLASLADYEALVEREVQP